MVKATGPIVIEDDAPAPSPAEVAPVATTPDHPPSGEAMQTVARLAAARPNRLARWFWSLLGAITVFFLSVAAWNTLTGLLVTSPVLGWIATALVVAFVLVLLAIAVREAAAFARLRRMDHVQLSATLARTHGNMAGARQSVDRLMRLYRGREDTTWGRERFEARKGDVFDASDLLDLAEREILGPLDKAAIAEVEAAARQVATVTALVPLALADVVTALTANLRMIRRIAEVYGGRSGTLGAWRLTRAVLTHLVATGAVAVGDDLISSVAGGSVLGKLSRRFGEGVVNGALTARVGVAAMEVCRPMPFEALPAPKVSALITRAFAGLLSKAL